MIGMMDETLVIQDAEQDADAFYHVLQTEAGGTADDVDTVYGRVTEMSREAVVRAGLDASQAFAKVTMYRNDNADAGRLLHRFERGETWQIVAVRNPSPVGVRTKMHMMELIIIRTP